VGVITMDGRTIAGWATTIANIAAPTVTELTTGSTRLETLITPDGLDISAATATIDVSNLGSVANANRAGRITWTIKLTFHHDSVVDTAWNLFPYRTNGYLWVRHGVDKATAPASTQKVKIYACETGEPNDDKAAPDTTWDFMSDFFVTENGYNTRAVVA
jgi:hypothetical protein